MELLRSPLAVIQLQVEHNAFDRSAAQLSMSLGQHDNAPLRMVRCTCLRRRRFPPPPPPPLHLACH